MSGERPVRRNILLCTLGGSWAVVPEVYGFLAPDRLPLYRNHPDREEIERGRAELGLQAPDEVWLAGTRGASVEEAIGRLNEWGRLAPATIRIWQAEGTDQLASAAECALMRELLVRMCVLAQDYARGGQLVLSLAGGRKTMSADLQWAGRLIGCDALIHLVGKDPLPGELRSPDPARLAEPLPRRLCEHLAPVAMGGSERSDVLDVRLGDRDGVSAARFPLPLAAPGTPCVWAAPSQGRLSDELAERERTGGRLLGNYMKYVASGERHENWRSLYRLPPRVIERLRGEPLGAAHRAWLAALPKADLHRHLGGCLDLAAQRAVGQAVWENLRAAERRAALRCVAPLLQQRRWPDDWPERLRSAAAARAHCAAALLVEADDEQLEGNLYGATEPRVALKDRHPLGFRAYERPGELSGSALLAHEAAVEPYAQAVAAQCREERLVYCELRGSPQKYGDGRRFLSRFRDALREAEGEVGGHTEFRFIVIVDRRRPAEVAEVVNMAVAAKQKLDDFVAGLDVAGDETAARPEQIAPHFLPAFEACLPITIHAGEGEEPESIWQAAYHLHADRIGHGLTLRRHPALATRFRDRGVALELCPTSNREVVGYRDPDVPESVGCPAYPLADLWRDGLPLTVCTDNPGISRTDMTSELLAAARMSAGRLTCWDALAIVKQSLVHAFCSASERERLLKRADAAVYEQTLCRFQEAPP